MARRELTPEMIDAGVEELYSHDITEPRLDEMREAVAAVYRVMVAAETEGQKAYGTDAQGNEVSGINANGQYG